MNDDMRFLVECLTTELVMMLMNKYGWDMRHAFNQLYASETYHKLCDPKCGLYYQGAGYVFQYLENEIENGVMA